MPTTDLVPADRRLLLVHAHPDDEVIGTGVTMAMYAHEGAQVTLVTCTLGEEGEILVPELAYLAADRTTARRAPHHRARRGDDGARRDRPPVPRRPGPVPRLRHDGAPPNDRPDCFWQADLDEAAAGAGGRPARDPTSGVVTYDENGGYGHPDHIQAHRVDAGGVEPPPTPIAGPSSARPGRRPSSTTTCCPSRCSSRASTSSVSRGRHELLGRGGDQRRRPADGHPRRVGHHEGRRRGFFEAKMDAMRAHATQIAVDGPFFALADGVGHDVVGHRVLPAGAWRDRRPGRRAGSGDRPVQRRRRLSRTACTQTGELVTESSGKGLSPERIGEHTKHHEVGSWIRLSPYRHRPLRA